MLIYLINIYRIMQKFWKFWLILVVICSFFAFYHAEKGDTFFGKNEQVCNGEKCDEKIVKNLGDIDEDELMMQLNKIKAPKKVANPVKVEGIANLSQNNKEINKLNEKPKRDVMNEKPDVAIQHENEENTSNEKLKFDVEEQSKGEHEEVNIIITFTNAGRNYNLKNKFTLTVGSLLEHATVPLKIHVIGDEESQEIANEIINKMAKGLSVKYQIVKLDVDDLARRLDDIVKPMQHHFSYKPGAYYNHALFFLSIAIHRVMPETMKRVIMLDADLKFMTDIKELYAIFDKFTEDNIMAIGRDLQPVYRHLLWKHRRENPNTRVGEPPPDGLSGFNSGVLLLNLEAMRKSNLYNSLLNADSVKKMTDEFDFKGHLGDQDFFSLISFKYEKLFYVLPCTWNRQLCTWWKKHGGYNDVFHLYFDCEGEVKIYHGNCDTPIP